MRERKILERKLIRIEEKLKEKIRESQNIVNKIKRKRQIYIYKQIGGEILQKKVREKKKIINKWTKSKGRRNEKINKERDTIGKKERKEEIKRKK